MKELTALSIGLGGLPLLRQACTRAVSAENPTGEKGMAARAVPNPADPDLPHSAWAMQLGQGWKVRPFVKPRAGETLTLMDKEGPGIIQHVFMVTSTDWKGNGRACILRFFWDEEETPSVEVPLTDFFAVGHEIYAPVNSLAVVVNPTSALSAYWPMPFRRHARVTFTNESDQDLELLAYQITYAECEVPEAAGYFHAQWRRALTDPEWPEYVIVDGIKGQGHYVGTFLAWTQLSTGWFGEGEVKFYLDGDTDFPTIAGTGMEDYFLGSYGFPQVYSTLYGGCSLRHIEGNGPPKWSMYRWHILDPICFQRDLRVTVQALGWRPGPRYKGLDDDVASVAYWYQTEPHVAFPALPSLEERRPR